MFKTIKSLFTKSVAHPVLTTDLVQFRRTTNRYGKLGTFSTNRGYIVSLRNPDTGLFEKAK